MFVSGQRRCGRSYLIVKIHQNTNNFGTSDKYKSVLCIIQFGMIVSHENIIANGFNIVCIILFLKFAFLEFKLIILGEKIRNNGGEYGYKCT